MDLSEHVSLKDDSVGHGSTISRSSFNELNKYLTPFEIKVNEVYYEV